MQSVSYNGSGYDIPDNGDRTWSDLTAYLVALASGSLVKAGGSFVLTNDVNFGSSKGLIAKYFTSVTAGAASTGAVRLANTDSISFRNSLNTLDLPLSLSTNTLQFNSLSLALLASTLTASRALASDASGYLVSSATTATQLGYLSTTSSDVQTQINTNSTNISTNLTTLTNHTGASTGVHGVTGAVVGTTDSQTLSAKTLTTPQVNGLKVALATKTAAYTLANTDDVILGNSASPFTYTLPATTGKTFFVKNINTGVMTLTPTSGLIDGQTSYLLPSQYDAATVVFDGTNYSVLETNVKVSGRYYSNTTQSMAVGTTFFKTELKDYDTHSAFSVVSSVSRFTAPIPGKYSFMVSSLTGAPASNGQGALVCRKNGATYVALGYITNLASGNNCGLILTDTVNLAATDYIEFAVYASVAISIGPVGSPTPVANTQQLVINVQRIGN